MFANIKNALIEKDQGAIRIRDSAIAWILGGTSAMTVHVVIGLAVAALAAVELWIMSQDPPRLTTHS